VEELVEIDILQLLAGVLRFDAFGFRVQVLVGAGKSD